MDGARRRLLRRDDEPPGRPARTARRARAVQSLTVVGRVAGARRHAEGPLRDARRPPGRGGADALPGRPAVGVRLVAVGLPAHLHVLRDRADEVRPEPDRLGDPRPGAPFPPDRADRPRRLHGDGRADAEPRPRARGRRGACPISASPTGARRSRPSAGSRASPASSTRSRSRSGSRCRCMPRTPRSAAG